MNARKKNTSPVVHLMLHYKEDLTAEKVQVSHRLNNLSSTESARALAIVSFLFNAQWRRTSMKLEVVDGGVEIKIEESSSLLFVEGGRCPLFERRTFINVSSVYRDKLAEEKLCRGGVRSLTYRSIATARSYAHCIHTLRSLSICPHPFPSPIPIASLLHTTSR